MNRRTGPLLSQPIRRPGVRSAHRPAPGSDSTARLVPPLFAVVRQERSYLGGARSSARVPIGRGALQPHTHRLRRAQRSRLVFASRTASVPTTGSPTGSGPPEVLTTGGTIEISDQPREDNATSVLPCHSMFPESGRSHPHNRFNSVVFPDPDGPPGQQPPRAATSHQTRVAHQLFPTLVCTFG